MSCPVLSFPDVLLPVVLPDRGQIHLALGLSPRVGGGHKVQPQGLHLPMVGPVSDIQPFMCTHSAHMYSEQIDRCLKDNRPLFSITDKVLGPSHLVVSAVGRTKAKVPLSGDSHHFLWFLKSLGQLAPSQLTRHLRSFIHSL